MASPFLSAEWRHLVMLNYEVPRELLEPLAPAGTVVDTFQGVAYASMVGFLFLNTRVKGIPVPCHRNFEEVNLRFYVRRFTGEEWRRGVVFVRELVPRAAIARVARDVYHEPYLSVPMRHEIRTVPAGIEAAYEWRSGQRWNRLWARTGGEPNALRPGTLDEFITEHYWGYNRRRDGGTMEYQVEHPSWRVWQVSEHGFDCDVRAVYGDAFVEPLSRPARSAFLAEGSAVTVAHGRRIQ